MSTCSWSPPPYSTSHGVSSQAPARPQWWCWQWWTRSGRAEQDRDLHTVTMLPAFPTTTHHPAQPDACFIMSMSLAHVRSYLHIYTSSLNSYYISRVKCFDSLHYYTIDRWTENILFFSSLSQVSNLRYEGYGQKRQRNHDFNMDKNISARGVFIVI